MSDQVVVGIASAVGVAMGLAIHQSRLAKKNKALGERIVAVLRDKGPRTLRELSEDLGTPGLFGRGNVFNALGSMVQSGTLTLTPAPPGTPQLKKVDYIRYGLSPGG